MDSLIKASSSLPATLPHTKGLCALVARTKSANFYENICRLGDMVKQRGLQNEPEVRAMICHLRDKATDQGDVSTDFFQAEGDAAILQLFRNASPFRDHVDIRDAWDHVMVGDLLHLLELRDMKKANILSSILFTAIKCDDPAAQGRSGYIDSLAGHLGEDMLELSSASKSYSNTAHCRAVWDEKSSCSLKDVRKVGVSRKAEIESYSDGKPDVSLRTKLEDEMFPRVCDYYVDSKGTNQRITPWMAHTIISEIAKGRKKGDEGAVREHFKNARTLRLAVLNHELEKYISSRRSAADLLRLPITVAKYLLRIK